MELRPDVETGDERSRTLAACPLEECLLERSLPLEADETLSVNGRSWLTLK